MLKSETSHHPQLSFPKLQFWTEYRNWLKLRTERIGIGGVYI
jgi:hypothetical protein